MGQPTIELTGQGPPESMKVVASILLDADEVAQLPSASPSIGVDPAGSVTDGRNALAKRLLGRMQDVSALSGWDLPELCRLLGCEQPDPTMWHGVDERVLQQSVQVVGFIADMVDHVRERRTADALPGHLEALGSASDEPVASVPERLARVIAVREAARETMNLCIEILARVHGDIELARSIFQGLGPGPSSEDFLALDRLGSARYEALRRLRSFEWARQRGAGEHDHRLIPISDEDVKFLTGTESVRKVDGPIVEVAPLSNHDRRRAFEEERRALDRIVAASEGR